MSTTQEMKWYAVRSISGKESKTKHYIETEMSRMGMSNLLGQVLIPTEKVYQIRNGKKVLKERNFFPGYIMIEAILTGEFAHTLKNVTNVIGFLSETKGGKPTPLRQNEVNRMLGKVD